jgi:serine/threonine-protein kinase
VRERLELFLDVARAVQFAHANLVLHCDLKPSNVLVTPAGTVVLLDFGVAKLLEGDDASDPTRTFVPLTPRYASPEQLERRRLTVATDVFALGLVLYELLGERPAFPDATFAAPRPEPPPPSALANRRALRGDLDAIVARAIEPDPGRRYASVELLALDVRRYLDGEPVSARRADAWNRAVKLMRRNRVLAGALAGLILVLGAGLVGTSLGKTRAEDNASRGWGAHAQARFASEVIADVLVAGATSGASWDAVLDEAETRLATELSHLPETEALTRLALGRLALSLGQPERAGGHLERALELARSRRGLNWRDTASAYELLAEARWDTDRAAAVAALEAALAVRLDASAPDPDAVEATRRTLARARAD